MDSKNGLLSAYNKLESSGCISKEWRLSEYNSLFGMTEYALLPESLAALSARLQNEKEGIKHINFLSSTSGHWSTFNTGGWIKAVGLALSTQFYSHELKEKINFFAFSFAGGLKINPILKNYKTLFSSELVEMIEALGPKDALETMKWTKDCAKSTLQGISVVKEDNTLQKADSKVVDQMSNLFSYRRNNYPVPDWLQIYSPETIEALGGVELLQQAINAKGEEVAKELLSMLAEGIESERRYEFRKNGEKCTLTYC